MKHLIAARLVGLPWMSWKIFNKNMANQPSNYPAFDNLESRENVLITPHTAFYTDEAVRNMVEQSLDASRELILTEASDKLVKLG